MILLKYYHNKFIIKQLSEFIKRFEETGPGAVGHDMDLGLKLMDQYTAEFQHYEEQRIEFVNAEKLFDMPLADYSDFLRIKRDFEGMQMVYKLYRQQMVARSNWSKTLWSNLNPQALVDGIEVFLKEFRKLPRWIRLMPIGQMLDIKIKQFKNSIPLMVNLKNEALRERHWNMLMEKTGQVFDMSPERFTLENMFAMELHRYQDIAEGIVNNAVKELQIEKGVKIIIEIWDTMAFTVHKHYKGAEDRGFILNPVEEIMQVLEENSMNLQGMAASQYVFYL